jgi:hypothetical protein
VVDVVREEVADARVGTAAKVDVVGGQPGRANSQGASAEAHKQLAELVLKDLSPILAEIYSVLGRPSIPTRASAQSIAADGALHDSQRAEVL